MSTYVVAATNKPPSNPRAIMSVRRRRRVQLRQQSRLEYRAGDEKSLLALREDMVEDKGKRSYEGVRGRRENASRRGCIAETRLR